MSHAVTERSPRCAHGDMQIIQDKAYGSMQGILPADLQGSQADLGDIQFSRSEKSFGVSCSHAKPSCSTHS